MQAKEETMRRLSLALLALVPTIAAQDTATAYLGVHVAGVLDGRHDFPIPKGVDKGVVLTQVQEDSAAERAGLRKGDILVFFDGKYVESLEALIATVQRHKPGDKVTYKVLRGTGSIEGTLKLGKRPPMPVEETPRPKPRETNKEAPAGDLDKRLDRVAAQLEAMRRRLTGGKGVAAKSPLARWMELANQRMDRIEKKLDKILELLKKRK